MFQPAYRRRNVGPLTQFGRFTSRNRTARTYTRGYRRLNYGRYSRLPARRYRLGYGPGQTFNVKQTVLSPAIYSGTGFNPTNFDLPFVSGAASLAAVAFSAQDLPSIAQFAGVFDQYRIIGVSMQLTPAFNNWNAGSVAIPRVYIVTDADDSNAPTAVTDLTAYNNCKIWQPLAGRSGSNSFKLFIRPNVTPGIFAVGAFSGYAVAPKGRAGPWIDLANRSVPYYSVKLAADAVTATPGDFRINMSWQYYVQFRGQR